MLKINKLRMALMNQAHTVMGRRGRVIPFARKSMVVTLKFRAFTSADAQKRATLEIQRLSPVSGERKNAAVTPIGESTVPQKASRLRVGKAISRAPIWM